MEGLLNPLKLFKNDDEIFPDLKDKFDIIDIRVKNTTEELP